MQESANYIQRRKPDFCRIGNTLKKVLIHSVDSTKPFIWYNIRHCFFASIHFYSILRTNISGLKTPIVNKLFLFFTTTMLGSGFGPYHGLCHHNTPCKHIDITPTLGAMTHALGLGVLAPQPEL
jgi:hypothetical protein